MARDATTLAIFTTADDAIQGLLGLHACINAAYDLVPKDQLVERLPKGEFRLTHEWTRHYDRNELVDATEQFFEFVQSPAVPRFSPSPVRSGQFFWHTKWWPRPELE